MANNLRFERLDHVGIGAILRSGEMAAVVNKAARDVVSSAEGQGRMTHDGPLPIDLQEYTTDRAAALVALAHPSGMAMEAKYGVLTKAAAAAGLEVSGEKVLLSYTTKSGKTRSATAAQIANWTRGR